MPISSRVAEISGTAACCSGCSGGTTSICLSHVGRLILCEHWPTQPSAGRTTLHSAVRLAAPAAHCGGSTCRTRPGRLQRCPGCVAPPELWAARRSCSCALGGPRPIGGGHCRCRQSAGDQLQLAAELCTCRRGRCTPQQQVTHSRNASPCWPGPALAVCMPQQQAECSATRSGRAIIGAQLASHPAGTTRGVCRSCTARCSLSMAALRGEALGSWGGRHSAAGSSCWAVCLGRTRMTCRGQVKSGSTLTLQASAGVFPLGVNEAWTASAGQLELPAWAGHA